LNEETATGLLDDDAAALSKRLPPNEYLTLGPPVPKAWLTTALAKKCLLDKLKWLRLNSCGICL